MSQPTRDAVLSQRLRRQRFLDPLLAGDEAGYRDLFRLLQPVAPVHRSRPGNPPRLVHRTAFDDAPLAARLRRRQQLVKARFSGGRVGYVLAEDLADYAVAFRRPLRRILPLHREIMAVIGHSGGLAKSQLKEELRHPAGRVTRALNRLQEAFLVYEHQLDPDWDTGWLNFKTEWFDPEVGEARYRQAVDRVVGTFFAAMIFATLAQLRDWRRLPVKALRGSVARLEERGDLTAVTVDGLGAGWLRPEDRAAVTTGEGSGPTGEGGKGAGAGTLPGLESVFMLHQADFLVRAHASQLRARYEDREVLQYLLIDGRFQGAVLGHWRIGPHDVEEILVELEPAEAEARREAILAAVRAGYPPERAAMRRYNGQPL